VKPRRFDRMQALTGFIAACSAVSRSNAAHDLGGKGARGRTAIDAFDRFAPPSGRPIECPFSEANRQDDHGGDVAVPTALERHCPGRSGAASPAWISGDMATAWSDR